MKLSQIYNILNTLSPFELQEKWDNSGLNIGSMDKEIENIYVSLDIDSSIIEKMKPNSLLITHHPLIFGGLKSLDFSLHPSNLIEKLIKKDISLIAMHTNFDKTHLNRYVFEEVLGFSISSNENFIISTQEHWNLEELKKHLKKRLGIEYLRIINPKEQINSLSMCTGSGASLMDSVKSECFLTGDIKYHDAIKAIEQDLMMIEIGHYESEKFFNQIISRELEFLSLYVIMLDSKNPFTF